MTKEILNPRPIRRLPTRGELATGSDACPDSVDEEVVNDVLNLFCGAPTSGNHRMRRVHAKKDGQLSYWESVINNAISRGADLHIGDFNIGGDDLGALELLPAIAAIPLEVGGDETSDD